MAKKKSKDGGNVYDRIFRENSEGLFIPITELELDFKIKHYKVLPDKITRTVQREVDFLYEVELEDGTQLLLHLEFQTKNDKNMVYRVGFYHGMVSHKYQKPIRHVVVYLGERKATMRTQLHQDEVYTGFDLINVRDMNTDVLLSSQVPEVILLAFLSDVEPEKREAVLRLVIQQLKKYSDSKSELSRYLEQLTILAKLRNFDDEAIKIIRDMPLLHDYDTDITENILFKEGIEKGIEINREKLVIRSLEKGTPYEEIMNFMEMTWEEVEAIDQKRKANSETDKGTNENEK